MKAVIACPGCYAEVAVTFLGPPVAEYRCTCNRIRLAVLDGGKARRPTLFEYYCYQAGKRVRCSR